MGAAADQLPRHGHGVTGAGTLVTSGEAADSCGQRPTTRSLTSALFQDGG